MVAAHRRPVAERRYPHGPWWNRGTNWRRASIPRRSVPARAACPIVRESRDPSSRSDHRQPCSRSASSSFAAAPAAPMSTLLRARGVVETEGIDHSDLQHPTDRADVAEPVHVPVAGDQFRDRGNRLVGHAPHIVRTRSDRPRHSGGGRATRARGTSDPGRLRCVLQPGENVDVTPVRYRHAHPPRRGPCPGCGPGGTRVRLEGHECAPGPGCLGCLAPSTHGPSLLPGGSA